MIKQTLEKYGVKTVLSQNKKMKNSSQGEIMIFNWGIPAFRAKDGFATCPNAGRCAVGCYAKSGAYLFSNVAKAFENRLALSKDENFDAVMIDAITKAANKAKKQNKQCLIRIHDSGDFYSLDYTLTWFRIMSHFKTDSNIKFYAYTKQVEMFNDLRQNYSDSMPQNFSLIYSFGGKQDDMINIETDRHSAVFETEAQLLDAGYINASHDDTLALTENKKIGLVYHGNKGFDKTQWKNVKVA